MANSSSILRHVAVPQDFGHGCRLSYECPQIGLLRGGTKATGRFGCPIEAEQFSQMPAPPQDSPDYGEETGETVLPRMLEGQVAYQQVGQQTGPDLPAHGISVMAEKVGQLHGLLDLLEEHLDVPSATVEFGHGPGAPGEVVGQELQLPIFPVEFHQRHHPAQPFGVRPMARKGSQLNHFVAQHPGVIGGFQGLDDAAIEVFLGSGDPEDAIGLQTGQVVKIHVGLVKNNDFTGLEPSTQFPRLGVIVKPSGIDDDTPRQETLQVQPDVTLGGRLAAPMLGPIQALGHQLDGGRIHRMDRPVEPPQVLAPELAVPEGRALGCQNLKHLPVQRFRHQTRPFPVRMTQRVLRGGCGPSYRCQHRLVHAQPVTHIVQTHRVSQLGVQQTHHMTPRRKPPAPRLYPVQLRQPVHQMRRNQVAYLSQYRVRKTRWTEWLFLFHPYRVAGRSASVQHFF